MEQYGQMSLSKLPLSAFMGAKETEVESPVKPDPSTPVRSEEVPKYLAEVELMMAKSEAEIIGATVKLQTLRTNRRQLQADVDAILDHAMDMMADEFHSSNGNEIPLNMDGLSLEVMETCYNPIVEAFTSTCYRVDCNSFMPSVLGSFAEWCEKGYDGKFVTDAINDLCDKPKCGVH